jgi:hypothetical protein
MKYSYPNTTVTVSLKKHRDYCIFSVSSHGDTISRSDLKNIFKRFYRVDKARNANHSYGLGLSIAESITKVGDDVSSNIDKTGSKLTSQVGKVAKQQDLYTRARTLKACGYTFGGLCFVGCLVWAVCSPQFQEGKTPWAPIIVGSLGSVAIFAGFAVPANNLELEADLMSCQVLGQYEFNEHFAMNVQGFHYQPRAARSYGVGLEIRF